MTETVESIRITHDARYMFRDGPTCAWTGPVSAEAAARFREHGFEIRVASASELVWDRATQMDDARGLLAEALGVLDRVRHDHGDPDRSLGLLTYRIERALYPQYAEAVVTYDRGGAADAIALERGDIERKPRASI